MAPGEAGGRVEISMRNKLKVLRAEHNWSQAELGKLVGVSRQAINAIERGKHHPSLPLAYKLADLFKLQVEEIFFRDEPKGDQDESLE